MRLTNVPFDPLSAVRFRSQPALMTDLHATSQRREPHLRGQENRAFTCAVVLSLLAETWKINPSLRSPSRLWFRLLGFGAVMEMSPPVLLPALLCMLLAEGPVLAV